MDCTVDANNDDDRVATLQSICGGIAIHRAKELLEAANGNLERAVDIFFHQQQEQQQQQQEPQPQPIVEIDVDTSPQSKKRPRPPHMENQKRASTPQSKSSPITSVLHTKKNSSAFKSTTTPSPLGKKQARLDLFFDANESTTKSSMASPAEAVSKSNVLPDGATNVESNTTMDVDTNNVPPLYEKASTLLLSSSSSSSFTSILPTTKDPFDNVKSHDETNAIFDSKVIDQVAITSPATSSDATEEMESSPPSLNKNIPAVKKIGKEEQEEDSSPDISFQFLAETLQKLTDTTKRLVKLDVLKQFIIQIIIEQHSNLECRSKTLTYGLLLVLGFRGGNQAPLEIGGSALSKALQTILGASRTQLSKGYRQYGDMGDAAASLFQKKTFFVTSTKSSLTVVQVYESFEKIVATDGRDAKQHILLQLLRACNSKIEIRFLVRLLIGNMRVGANLKTVLAALAMAFVPNDPTTTTGSTTTNETKQAIDLVQKTHDVCPNLQAIIDALLKGGLEQVRKDCTIQLLTPIAPMLAHPIHSLDQVSKAMGDDGNGDDDDGNNKESSVKKMTMEWKYDGVRCQTHYDGTTVRLFSRHMLETTEQYPDAAKSILAARRSDKTIDSFIIDAEIVGVEGEGDDFRLLPFQDLSRRKKKNNDGQGVKVKVFAFDLMYLNGCSLIDKCLEDRQMMLQEYFTETDDFAYVSSKALPAFDEAEIRLFLEAAVEKGAEGLMLKMLGSNSKDEDVPAKSLYEAGTRSHCWLKVKRDYVAGYADTIDVVPIGAWYGNGRKAQKSFLSPVLLAVYDEDEDVYRSISRCMSFTDAMYDAMREFYFRGTPYPATVGIAEGTQKVMPSGDAAETVEAAVNEDENDHDSDSGHEEDDRKADDGANEGVGESLVNCFPDRPSSAYVVTNESPPIWFKPLEVFEVSFADMSLSRQHTAGAGLVDDSEGRGIALRFPRFKRRRPDKKPEQATTSLQIAQLFSQQSKTKSSGRQSGKAQQ